MLTLRDREITKVGVSAVFSSEKVVSSHFYFNTLLSNVPVQKDILMDKIKSSHVENHNMIEV